MDTRMDEVMCRLREVERLVGQKADEVVSSQVRQQRAEIEELRMMILELKSTFEHMQRPTDKPPVIAKESRPPAAADTPSLPSRQRGVFRSLF